MVSCCSVITNYLIRNIRLINDLLNNLFILNFKTNLIDIIIEVHFNHNIILIKIPINVL